MHLEHGSQLGAHFLLQLHRFCADLGRRRSLLRIRGDADARTNTESFHHGEVSGGLSERVILSHNPRWIASVFISHFLPEGKRFVSSASAQPQIQRLGQRAGAVVRVVVGGTGKARDNLCRTAYEARHPLLDMKFHKRVLGPVSSSTGRHGRGVCGL